jgi:hypothetical protein
LRDTQEPVRGKGRQRSAHGRNRVLDPIAGDLPGKELPGVERQRYAAALVTDLVA